MKSHHRVIAAFAIFAATALPSFAFAASQPRERGSDKGPVSRVVQKLKKAFRITTLDDFPLPPVPPPKP